MNNKGKESLPEMEDRNHGADTVETNPCAGEGSERPLPTCEDCGCRLPQVDIQLGLKVCFWCDRESWTRETNHG